MLLLASCYMPIRFDAEIELTKTGYYHIIFDGYLAQVELYQDIKQGKASGTEERERVQIIRDDFERDPSTKEFAYIKQGHFKVHWERSGDLIKARTVTFFRRNEHILGLSFNKETGQISMLGKSLQRDVKDKLRAAGLDTSGNIRVFTDARVVTHNATSVRPYPDKGPNYKVYTWEIKNLLSPTPSLKLQL